MQHLTVRSAITFNLDDPSWSKTAAGLMHSNKFGFGKIDAWRIVEMAKTYKLAGPQTFIDHPLVKVGGRIPTHTNGINSTIVLTKEAMTAQAFHQLEHITVTVHIEHQRRGDLEVFLISPNNVVSQLSRRRKNDESGEGFNNWTFMTVKHW
jgi:kexin